MTPDIFEIVNASEEVKDLLRAGNVTRFYPFGRAPQNGKYPYAVWRQVGGSPENYLAKRPDIDSCTLQIDVYATPEQGVDTVREVAKAIRNAIETKCHITSWRGESPDPKTGNLNISFDSSWLVKR